MELGEYYIQRTNNTAPCERERYARACLGLLKTIKLLKTKNEHHNSQNRTIDFKTSYAIGFGLYGFIKKEFYSLGTIFAGISLVISFILFIIEKNNPK